ncbi:MAG: HAMP domain-containing sensor histidine kinase [Rubrivivax sp.]
MSTEPDASDTRSAPRDAVDAAPPRSILRRVVRAQLWWSLLWGGALALAVGLAMQHEVDELLDDSLQSASEGLIGPLVRGVAVLPPLLVHPGSEPGGAAGSVGDGSAADHPRNGGRFVWQLVEHAGAAHVVAADAHAPSAALRATPTPGFSQVPGWRVYGAPSGSDGRMLYVAQSTEERDDVQIEVALAVVLASLPMALLALPWLRSRVRHELQPLQRLSERLQGYDPLQRGATLGLSQHTELRPVQEAIDALAARLAQRVADERAFTAHAAHALRTPLAGIDAQLAVALREAPEALQPRLRDVRAAAARLQRVVVALLAMFRSGFEVQRTPIALGMLTTRLRFDGLRIDADPADARPLQADADLLVAALLNLLDNAVAHGATRVELSVPRPGVLRLQDNGSGIEPGRLDALRSALAARDYEGRMGLGLMLADLVARAHGGRLGLPPPAAGGGGFCAELLLTDATAEA